MAGSDVSRGHLFKNRVVERLVRHQPLQPGVLLLERLHPLRLVEAQAAVLFPPSIVGLLADAELRTDLRDAQPAASFHLGLTQLRDDVLRAEPLAWHPAASRVAPESYHSGWTGLRGQGQCEAVG